MAPIDMPIGGRLVLQETFSNHWLETLKLIKKEPTPTPSIAAGRVSNSTHTSATPEAGQTADAKPGGIANSSPS